MLSKRAIINEVIKEWSWRVPNGMPDVNKSDHLNILRELLIADFGASTYTVNNVIHSLSGKKTDKQEMQEIAINYKTTKIVIQHHAIIKYHEIHVIIKICHIMLLNKKYLILFLFPQHYHL